MQVLWSKNLWKTNPSGVPETYGPAAPARPAPIHSAAKPTRAEHDIAAPRDGRGDKERGVARANRNRLQAYSAVTQEPSASSALATDLEETPSPAHAETQEEARHADVEVTTSPRGQATLGSSR